MIDCLKPDVVIGKESWLNEAIKDKECFPVSDYQIKRRVREHLNSKGGIFIMAKHDFILDRVSEMETNCELLRCKVSIQGTKQLLIGAYYYPKEDDADSLTELEESLTRQRQPCPSRW